MSPLTLRWSTSCRGPRPAGVAATAGAIRELRDHDEQLVARQGLALEPGEYEAQRAERQFNTFNPEKRLSPARLSAGSTKRSPIEPARAKLAAPEHVR